ncbi:MAG: lipid-binding SYLF domain-containing protein [Desulfovibrionaceae bacterium]
MLYRWCMERTEPRRSPRLLIALLAAALLAAACTTRNLASTDASKPQRLVDKALDVLKELDKQPELKDLMDLAAGAEGLVVLPETTKIAFLYGGQLGDGVILGRNATTGKWSYPAFCAVGDMSAGLQAGFQTGPLVLVLLTDTALSLAVDTGFSLGGDASVTFVTGTVSNFTSTRTAGKDVVHYWDPMGAYAGVSLKGGLLTPLPEMNARYYLDPDATSHRVVVEGKYANPGAQQLRDFLDRLSTEAWADGPYLR